MIKLDNLTFTFQGAESPVINRATLSVEKGEICLVTGQTGSGKSTFLKMLNGLVPHFSNGRLSGSLAVDSIDLTGSKPHDFAHLVGYVNQQPGSAFVSNMVEDELAFGLEQLGIERARMKALINQIATQLEIEDLLARNLSSLSGGEQQKVAIAAALVAGQKILLLDEPTSALDDDSAQLISRLLSDLASQHGVAILIAEHRHERLLTIAHSQIAIDKNGLVVKTKLTEASRRDLANNAIEFSRPAVAKNPRVFHKAQISIEHDGVNLLRNASINLSEGQITGLVGPNGCGKSSLLWSLASDHPGLNSVALVPQVATDLLIMSTLRDEFSDSDAFAGVESGTTGKIFESLAGRIDPSIHPRDLSSGQQVALALAIQLAKSVDLVLLDEPTSGLDHHAKQQLANQLAKLRDEAKMILIASHDIHFVEQVANRVLTIASGQIIEVSR